MKKIQFMLVALFAVLSTNVFAQYVPGSRLTKGQKQTIDGIEYTVTGIYNTEDPDEGQINTVSAAMNNFTGTAIEIPATVTFDVEGKDDTTAPGIAIKKAATFKVTKILDNGFNGLTGVTSLSIGKNVVEIGKTAFEGCENLATVTFEEGSLLTTMGNGAFSYTSIESIDFTNCTKLVALGSGAKATGETGSPFTSTSHKTNIMLATVVLPTQCVTVSPYAFVGCTALSTISLVKVKTIGTLAFDGCTSLASAVIGTTATNVAGIGVKAFNGCTALLSVEFGTLTGAVVEDDAFTGCTKLAEFSFNAVSGANTIGKKSSSSATSPYDLASVRTVNFKKYISKDWTGYTAGDVVIASGAFATNAFPAPTATAKNNIYYNAETVVFPTKDKDFYQPFAQDAFAASDPGTATITLTTSLVQFTNINGFNKDADALFKVTISAGYTDDFVIGYGDDKVLIQDKNNTKNYYYFAKGANDFSIAKSQESGATVTVYEAYADVYKSVATLSDPDIVDIYFQPMCVVEGKYNIPAGVTAIIKSSQSDGVEASPYDAVSDGYRYSTVWGTVLTNMLNVTSEAYSALKVKTDLLNPGPYDLWFFNNPAASGLGFTKYNPSVQKGLAAGAVYMLTTPSTASARVNIIWLDGEATAIQKIKNTNKQEGAIYNLAGQKVSAAYKGVVIKDGKKYIQK